MNIRNNFLLVFIFVLIANTIASQTITGTVTDEKTNELIPFAAIALEGTTLGVITNYDGVFTIEIPENAKNSNLAISCVGYEPTKISVSKNLGRKNVQITLNPKFTDIEEVVVTEKSLKQYTILKSAASKIRENYISQAFNYKLHYKNSLHEKDRESIIMLYDKAGYGKTNAYQTFKDINYRYEQSKRSFELKTIQDRNTNLDQLLEFDIVRNSGNILDIKYIKDFSIEIEQETVYEGDSVWVLSYNCKNPNLLNTGDYYAVSYTGKIYIGKKDYAVLLNKTNVETSAANELGRDLYVKDATKSLIDYHFTTSYSKESGKYALKSITYSLNAKEKTQTELHVLDIKTYQPELISGREYLDNAAYDAKFRNEFGK